MHKKNGLRSKELARITSPPERKAGVLPRPSVSSWKVETWVHKLL